MRGAGAGGAAGARRTLLAVLLSGLPFSFLSLSLSFFFVVLSGCSSRTLSARGAGPEPGATISSGSSASGTTAEDEEDEPAEGLAARACSVRKGRGEASSPEEEEEARQELAASSSKLAVHPALRVPEKEDSPARRMAGSPWPGHRRRRGRRRGRLWRQRGRCCYLCSERAAAPRSIVRRGLWGSILRQSHARLPRGAEQQQQGEQREAGEEEEWRSKSMALVVLLPPPLA